MENHKKLYLLRHGTALPRIAEKEDFNRSLSTQGKKELAALKAYLKLHPDVAPKVILCSKAKRCKQTLQEIKECFEKSHIILHHFLYLSSAYTILEVLSFLDDSVDTVLIIGHEKAILEMLRFLIQDKEIRVQMFPKGCICGTFIGFDFKDATHWKDVSLRHAQVQNIFYP